VPPTPVRARIPQSLDILQHASLQLVLNLHSIQLRIQVQHLLLSELAHLHARVQVVPRHDARADGGPDAEKGLERAGEEAAVGEVAGEEEDLERGSVSGRGWNVWFGRAWAWTELEREG
jgi:hypothetical protein